MANRETIKAKNLAWFEEFKTISNSFAQQLSVTSDPNVIFKLYKEYLQCILPPRNAMILANQPLLTTLTKAVLKLLPAARYYKNDLEHIGNIPLVGAVDKLIASVHKTNKKNPSAFLRKKILMVLQDGPYEDQTVQILPRTRRNHKDDGILDALSESSRKYLPTYNNVKVEPVDTYGAVDLEDVLDKACLNDNDRIMMRMRINGKDHKTIAKALGTAVGPVFRNLQAIYERYQQLTR